MVEKVQGKNVSEQSEQSTASLDKYQESINAKFKNINIHTYDANGNGVIEQPELEKAMDDFQSNKSGNYTNHRWEAIAKGYQTTYNPNFLYDPKTKKHFIIDKSGELLEAKDVSWVGKDGSYAKRMEGNNGTQKYVGYDKSSYPKEMKAYDASGKKLVGNAKDSAAGLGLRSTFASDSKGIYYDEATKIHYQWDDKSKTFKAMKGVGMVSADGRTFDNKGQDGNATLHKDGSVEIKEANYTSTFKFNNKGEVISAITRDTDGSKSVREINKFGQFIEYNVDANGNSNKNELYTFYPDGHINTEVFYDNGNKYLTTYRQDGSVSSYKTTDSHGHLIGLRRENVHGKPTYDYTAEYAYDYDGKPTLINSYEKKYDSQGNYLGGTEKYLTSSDGMFTTRYDSKGRTIYHHRDYGDLSSTVTFTYTNGKNNTSIQKSNEGQVSYIQTIDQGNGVFETKYLTKEEYDALQK